ncbi:MAG: flippase-like domain-containing protein [Bacteroidales bacterium]|nr:flippase-like domain-containing protein [Bacteroidales bacterium]
MNKTVKYILSFALAALLVWIAFRSVDWKAFLEGLRLTRWGYVVPFLVASVVALVLRTTRWRDLLKSAGHEVPWIRVWDSHNVGNLANVALPGSGEFIRCGYVVGKSGYGDAFGTAMLERAWDVAAVIVMIILALVLDRGKFGPFFVEQVWTPLSGRLSFSLWWLVALLLVMLVLFFWAVFRFRERNGICRKVADAVSSVGRGFVSFGKLPHKGLFLLYTVLIWMMYLLMCFCILKAVPELSGLGMEDALFFTAVGNIASVIPVPGGIGAYHYLVALSVSTLYGGSWETGLLFATLQHEMHAILIIVLGVISYVALNLRSRNQRA